MNETWFDEAIIVGPIFEQRIAKLAHSLMMHGHNVFVLAETMGVAQEFAQYIQNVEFRKIPTIPGIIKRLPLDLRRKKFIRQFIAKRVTMGKRILLIARDITYGYIAGAIVRHLQDKNIHFVIDVADNYDLLYDAISNKPVALIAKIFFKYMQTMAFKWVDSILVVTDLNRRRIQESYGVNPSKVITLQNLPMQAEYPSNCIKTPKTLVYVGRIDEISRDPFYILQQLEELPEWSLHFYSSQKESTITKIMTYAREHGMSERVVFHSRVPYHTLATEIARYEIGVVPHKRNLLTDYTVPNKIYDYKNAGIITLMSDNPALVEENRLYKFGVVYSKSKDNFKEALMVAHRATVDRSTRVPTWIEAFDAVYNTIVAQMR
jgi:glycosyltransferase involved in cell wall biosynthesis